MIARPCSRGRRPLSTASRSSCTPGSATRSMRRATRALRLRSRFRPIPLTPCTSTGRSRPTTPSYVTGRALASCCPTNFFFFLLSCFLSFFSLFLSYEQVNNTQRDPSTAWQTKAGEWRLTTYDGLVYRSMDFQVFSKTKEE